MSRYIPLVTTACRLGLAGVLIYAGWTKFPLLQSVVAVKAYQLFPDGLAEVIGYALPLAEIALGLLLAAGLITRVAAILSGLLMLAFIAGIASAWARGLSIDCGCFGGGGQIDASQTQYPQEILRDLGFAALAVWTAVFPPGALALDRWLGLAPEKAADTTGRDDETDAADEGAEPAEVTSRRDGDEQEA